MRTARLLALLVGLLVPTLLSSGCADDCRAYCRDLADLAESCFADFELDWEDIGEDGTYASSRDFVNQCRDSVDDEITRDIDATCADASDSERGDCETTVEQGVMTACRENASRFNTSCSDGWRSLLEFTPPGFDPEEPTPTGDDDDSAGDDDDSAGDDDDSAGDDDDSAGDDDDSAG